MSLNDQLQSEMKDISTKGSFFKCQEGENKIRILSEGALIGTHWVNNKPFPCYGETKGCPRHGEGAPIKDGKPQSPQVKFTCYVLDRADDKVKLADLPYSVIKKIGELQQDTDWSFDEFPMPYDVKITYKPKETPNNMYVVTPSPNRVSLALEHTESLRKGLEVANPIDLVKKKKLAQLNADQADGTWKEPVGLTEEQKADIQAARDAEIQARKERDISPDDIPF